MDDLIIRALTEAASPFEMERLRRWRGQSPENEQYFQETARVWDLTAPEPLQHLPEPPEVDVIITAAAGLELPAEAATPPSPQAVPEEDPGVLRHPGRQERRVNRNRTSWRRWGLMAASLAALALGIRVVWWSAPGPLATYQAMEGETLTVTLQDGSFVRLAGGSRLDEWDVEGSREVTLDGRAFFAVAHDEARPFTVRTGPGEVRVLGTRFELAREAGAEGMGGLRVVVVEGRVSVTNALGSVEVPAGSVAHMDEARAPTAQGAQDVWALLDWPDGVLVFQGTTLAQVAQEVARHFDRPLMVSGEALRDRRITAWFQADPFEEVAESLCLVAEAVCRVAGAGVAMEPGVSDGGVR